VAGSSPAGRANRLLQKNLTKCRLANDLLVRSLRARGISSLFGDRWVGHQGDAKARVRVSIVLANRQTPLPPRKGCARKLLHGRRLLLGPSFLLGIRDRLTRRR